MSSHQYTLGHEKFSKTLLSRLESTRVPQFSRKPHCFHLFIFAKDAEQAKPIIFYYNTDK